MVEYTKRRCQPKLSLICCYIVENGRRRRTEPEEFKERRTELGNFDVQWRKFRDPLRREDQLVLDEMFQALDIHKEACGSMRDRDRFAAAVVSMLIEQRKKTIRFEKQIDELERLMRNQDEGWLSF